MIVTGNPGRGTPSSYESSQTETIGYALLCKYPKVSETAASIGNLDP